jgi:hypothetical protein
MRRDDAPTLGCVEVDGIASVEHRHEQVPSPCATPGENKGPTRDLEEPRRLGHIFIVG